MKKNTASTFKKARVLFSSNIKETKNEDKKLPTPHLLAIPNEKHIIADPIHSVKTDTLTLRDVQPEEKKEISETTTSIGPEEKKEISEPTNIIGAEDQPFQEKMFVEQVIVEQNISSQMMENDEDISFEVSTISELQSPPTKLSEIQPRPTNDTLTTNTILEQHTVVRYDQ
jgi:hypothetical protein